MKKFANFVVKNKYWMLGIFFVLLVASAVAFNFVNVNYDLTKYLPDNTITKSSVQMMKDEFGASGTASIMITNINENDAKELALKLEAVEGVSTANLTRTQDVQIEGGQTQPCALISIFLENGDYTQEAEHAINGIKDVLNNELITDQHYYCTGSAISAITSRTAISQEIPIILLVAVAIVLVILAFTTRSWIEPVILLLVIGVAILINFGTNLILGEISFISNSISSVLLIALAMDYSIVLVSRFREEREKTPDVQKAMKNALAGSLTTIIASGCTVMAGLLSLVFMDYKIGFDMGIVLTKGVFISILAVIFLMPAILLLFSKIIAKTEHKNFLSGVKSIGTYSYKTRWVVPFVFIAIIATAGVIQFTSLQFDYVAKFGGSSSQIVVDEQKTKEVFGTQNALVVMVNKTLTPEQQITVTNDIKNLEVNGEKLITDSKTNAFMTAGETILIQGQPYTITLGTLIDATTLYGITYAIGDAITPTDAVRIITETKSTSRSVETDKVYAYELLEYMGDPTHETELKVAHPVLTFVLTDYYNQEQKANELFNGKTQTRMVFNINAEVASAEAKDFITKLNEYLNSTTYTYYVVNNTQNLIETESVFASDRLKVELISIGAILLIVLIAFRKISIPLILVVVIQGALWINLAGNALIGNSIFFICYLLGTAIQMGATIDYGILLTDRYVEARKRQNKKNAIKTAIDKSFVTIISSGSILTLAAFTIGIFSSVPLISSIGYLIGFGALCALLSMLFVLPQFLLIFDKFIIKKKKKSSEKQLENKNNVIEVKDAKIK